MPREMPNSASEPNSNSMLSWLLIWPLLLWNTFREAEEDRTLLTFPSTSFPVRTYAFSLDFGDSNGRWHGKTSM